MRDWDKAADDNVAILRAEAGRDPYDRSLSDLIGELSTRSDECRTRWASHDALSLLASYAAGAPSTTRQHVDRAD